MSASGEGADAARRAARLLRWYPGAWRDRYGDEFAELLISDIVERPRSASRVLDVARGGIVARLADAGLCGFPVAGQGRQPASSLASLSACLAVFVIVGAALWSQLTVGWQWSAPASSATMAGMVAMSIAVLVLAALAILAALPVGYAVTGRLLTGRNRRDLLVPLLVFALCLAAMFVGSRHFGNGWPGTGGRPWAGLRIGGHEWIGRGLVPGGLAAFSWAATLSVTTYWLHPAALATFPASEVAWMVASPLFLGAAIWAAAVLVRRAGLSPRVLAFEGRLAGVACAAMVVFFAGCGCWVVSGGRGLFHAGTIDVAGTCVLALVLAVAGRAASRAGLRPAGSLDLG
ncbi:MAG: hypothetical protein JWM19_6162 [Actinomycetia bacterium]|nr:hypothetical protein [Actinomycetes bacterium]